MKHMEVSWYSVGYAFCLFIFIRIVFPLCIILYRYLIAAQLSANVKRLRSSDDDWAVITGGTDGIGLAYARELAGLGFNICIISRSEEKLQNVSKQIEKEAAVKTKVIQADFTKTDIYSNIVEQFKDMKITILVNNVGMTQTYPAPLWQFPADNSFYVDFAHCNMTSAVMCTRAALIEGGMLERNRGLIINISSASGVYPLALAGMYSATKVFLQFFSRAVGAELKKTKISVQTVLPFYVLTKFIGRFRPPSFLAPTPDKYVHSALRMVGIEDRTHGTLSHAIQGLLMDQPPEWFRKRIAYYLHSLREKIVRGNQ